MSGAAAITYLLSGDTDMTGVVPTERIVRQPFLPVDFHLPAINVQQISAVERPTVSMAEASRYVTERVQVTAHARTIAEVQEILRLARLICAPFSGVAAGVHIDSILPDAEGPDLSQPDAEIFERSRDFIVRWHRPVA